MKRDLPQVQSERTNFHVTVQRPTMRFVLLKTVDQLDLQALHRVRDRLVARRTGVINQLRAFLLERGLTPRTGRQHLARILPELLAEAGEALSPAMGLIIERLRAEWRLLEDNIRDLTRQITAIARDDAACQRLVEIPGFGALSATALVAAIGKGTTFRKGRDLAAWLGHVPRQKTTGGKPTLLGISKRGNSYLRRLLLQGARSVHLLANRSRLGFRAADTRGGLSIRRAHSRVAGFVAALTEILREDAPHSGSET
jgi:transposase